MKHCEGQSIANTYEILYNSVSTKGLKPRFRKNYNEASKILIKSLQDKDVDYQLVPLNIYWRNASERAIQTFKKHFITGLCSFNTYLPLQFWDILLDQATTTLNMMHKSIINPNLSAHEQIFGMFQL